jgi:polysaccharide transporter, PST family
VGDRRSSFDGAAATLGAVAARGAAYTMGTQIARAVVQLAGLVILSRLLTPKEFGVVAVVVAVIGVGETIRDLGLSSAAIQAPTLSRAQRDNLFWVNTGLGVAIGLVVLLGSALLARIYDDDAVAPVAQVLSITFVLNGLAAQHRASLVRDLRFGVTSGLDLAGTVVGFVLAVALAVAGAGYWALVGQELARCAVTGGGAVLAAHWWPGRPRRGAQMGTLIRFGTHLLGSQLLSYASRNIDTAIVGARFGTHQAGVYARAFQLASLPSTQISAPATRVAVAVLSRLADRLSDFRRFLLVGQTVLLHLVVPLYAATIAMAVPLIDVTLGEAWGEASSLFQVLAIGNVFGVTSFAANWLFQSMGATRSQFRYALVTRPVLILAIVVGSAWGVYGVATGYTVGVLVVWPVTLWWAGRATGVPWLPLFANGIRAVAVYVPIGACVWLLVGRLQLGNVAMLFVGVAAFVALCAVVACCLPSYRRDLSLVATTVRLAVRGAAARESSAATG